MNRERSELLLGAESTDILSKKTVMLIGLGGVGSYTLEALARSGIGHIIAVDGDAVCDTNLNRQLLATQSTVGQRKAELAAARVHDIDQNIKVTAIDRFITVENFELLPLMQCDCIIDAIDTVGVKLALAEFSERSGVPLISSMGTGNKLDATAFRVDDIFNTSGCPLARVMRRELARRGVKHLRVVYSPEVPVRATAPDSPSGRHSPGSLPYIPGVAGLILASEAVKTLLK